MSRSVVGGKPFGWDYWGKRKGVYWVDRKTSHKMERMQLKEEDIGIVKDALFELGEGTNDLSRYSVYKSLFPKAKTIEYYHHYIFGYDVLVVDGKFHGELSRVDELLAFQYHTGELYEDIEDLESKYCDYLESYDSWSFLP